MARETFEGGEEVTTRDLPSGFKEDIQAVVVLAVTLGWKLIITSTASMTIISPDENKRLHFSNRRNSGPINRLRRTVIKYGDPNRIRVMAELGSSDITDHEYNTIVSALMSEETTLTFATPDMEPARERHQKEEPPVAKKRAAKKQATPKPTPPPKPERTLVSEKPMLARAHEGRAYESRIAIERTWSDGFVDYKCTRCDYTGERLSVRGHWQVHVRSGEVEAVGPGKRGPEFHADVPLAATYAPRQNRVEGLAQYLADLWADNEAPDFNALAKDALTWVHEQSRKGTELAAEREELSPEDMLNRIRTLLDQGQYDTQRQEINRLSSEVMALKIKWEMAEARAERALGDLRSLHELVAGINVDDYDDEDYEEEAESA